MAHSGAGRALATKGGYPVQVSGSLHGDVGYLDREPASSAVWKLRRGEEKEQKDTPPRSIVVEQWICFVWGFVCMAFGIWGICMRSEQDALPAYIAWLGSLHMPALRATPVACFGMGVVLIRRGWTHL
ncbi:hypothetical protein [Edaphobacter modestus]|uniref:Uncharacterized protein n=1 Tax=Edaphobacter modestus TaxID=388466 RepID=A0A4Q7YXF1_9BACT|nr:hypothetical protein [Edaphobacter modestus]RZU41891.1 hypothetical protein BDD14_3431 [Edaphobacter modestus]